MDRGHLQRVDARGLDVFAHTRSTHTHAQARARLTRYVLVMYSVMWSEGTCSVWMRGGRMSSRNQAATAPPKMSDAQRASSRCAAAHTCSRLASVSRRASDETDWTTENQFCVGDLNRNQDRHWKRGGRVKRLPLRCDFYVNATYGRQNRLRPDHLPLDSDS